MRDAFTPAMWVPREAKWFVVRRVEVSYASLRTEPLAPHSPAFSAPQHCGEANARAYLGDGVGVVFLVSHLSSRVSVVCPPQSSIPHLLCPCSLLTNATPADHGCSSVFEPEEEVCHPTIPIITNKANIPRS